MASNPPSIGIWKQVPITSCFDNEVAFTAWLAEPGNIASLGEVVGADLVKARTEVPAGGLRADIVCRDQADAEEHIVIVEAQLGKSDADHFGKLMRYRGVLNAKTCIWIAEEFRSEDYSGFESLNSATTDDVRFIAVSVEVFEKSGEYDVRFQVVDERLAKSRKRTSSPPKEIKEGSKGDLEVKYWKFFGEIIEKMGVALKQPSATNQPLKDWYCFNTRSIFNQAAFKKTHAWVRLVFKTPKPEYSKRDFDLLANDAAAIESELKNLGIDDKVIWERADGKAHSMMTLKFHSNLSDPGNWEESCRWTISRLKAIESVCGERVSTICNQ